jgi:hypothetical protein
MRQNLKESRLKKTARRMVEDEIRNWTTKGLADFGIFFVINSDDMDKLSKNVMTHLVDYLKIKPGGYLYPESKDTLHPFFE